MKWVVVYFFLQMVIIACPQPEPVPDQFGRIYPSNSMTLESCFETHSIRLEKKFYTKAEAKAFIEIAKREADLVGFEIQQIEE